MTEAIDEDQKTEQPGIKAAEGNGSSAFPALDLQDLMAWSKEVPIE